MRQRTRQDLSAGAFKIPIKNVIKTLSEKAGIAPDLEASLNAYVENRNLLIHHWIEERGWPADNDATGFAPIIELANRVEREAKELARQVVGSMVKFTASTALRPRTALAAARSPRKFAE